MVTRKGEGKWFLEFSAKTCRVIPITKGKIWALGMGEGRRWGKRSAAASGLCDESAKKVGDQIKRHGPDWAMDGELSQPPQWTQQFAGGKMEALCLIHEKATLETNVQPVVEDADLRKRAER